MLSIILSAVVAQSFPVELPREFGHLRLLTSKSTDKGIEIELEYENVTDATFSSVGVECTTFDHRDVMVNDEYRVLKQDGQDLAPGARMFAKLLVKDRVSRAQRAECVINRANKAKLQLAAGPSEEPAKARTKISRPSSPDVEPAAETAVPSPVAGPALAPGAATKQAASPAAPDLAPAKGGVSAPPAGAAPVAVPATPAPASAPPADGACCKKCGGNTKACGDACIPINQKCRDWAGCACTVE